MEPTPEQQSEQRHIADLEPQLPPIPDHPPYAEMVREALCALAEPGGSSEHSISDYIVSSFSGLPPGHDKLLPYYLRKLVSSSYLCVSSPGTYLLCPKPFRRLRPAVTRRRHSGRSIKHPAFTFVPRNKTVSVPVTSMQSTDQREESSSSPAPVPAAAMQQQPQTEGDELRQPRQEESSMPKLNRNII